MSSATSKTLTDVLNARCARHRDRILKSTKSVNGEDTCKFFRTRLESELIPEKFPTQNCLQRPSPALALFEACRISGVLYKRTVEIQIRRGKMSSRVPLSVLMVLFLQGFASGGLGQTYAVLYKFSGNDGRYPQGVLP